MKLLRNSSSIFLGAAAAIAISLLGLSVWRGGCVAVSLGLQEPAHESDRELIGTFQRHRARFEHLKQMMVQDEGLFTVTSDRTLPEDPSSVGIATTRIDEYRKVLKELGVCHIAITRSRNSIRIARSCLGFVTHNSEKGYIWSAEPFEEGVITELDSLSSRREGVGTRLIEDNWYLFFEGY